MQWALVLIFPAVFAATALSADPPIPEGTTVKLLLLRQKSVQKELGIAPEEAAKIKEFTQAQSDAARKTRDLGAEERKEAFLRLEKQNKDFLAKTLTEKQGKRLHQIMMQYTPLTQLLSPELAKELNLGEEQVGKLKDLQATARKELVAFLTAKEREGKNEKFAKLREDTRAKTLAVLTDDQKAKVREMVGAPFEGEIIFEEEEDK
jgi:Spy/CpxP family protein refolding chaperone